MTKQTQYFEHESLQDKEAIVCYLKALTDGIEKGEILFADDEDSLLLRPHKLGRLKIRANQNKKSQELRVKISWLTGDDSSADNSPLFIQAKKLKKSQKKS